MPDDTTPDDSDQRIPQSDLHCLNCDRPLPDARHIDGMSAHTAVDPVRCECPCGKAWTAWPHDDYPKERDPYPPHSAPWLDECDCDECAEPTHLEEAHMRATDHYSDTEDDMTDDGTTIDDPEAYLEDRYGMNGRPDGWVELAGGVWLVEESGTAYQPTGVRRGADEMYEELREALEGEVTFVDEEDDDG